TRADPGEEVEPRAGDLRAALDVDRTEQLAELEVVTHGDTLGREVTGGAHLAEHDEVRLAALGYAGLDDVGDPRCRRVELDRRLVGERLLGLDLLGERLGPGEELLLGLALGGGDVLAERLLLGAQLLER